MELTLSTSPLDWSTTEIFTLIYKGIEYKGEAFIQDSGEEIPDVGINIFEHGLSKDLKDRIESDTMKLFEEKYKVTRTI